MRQSIFKVEAVFAGKGDALVVHFGTTRSPRWMLIDGGHTNIYERFLRPRLDQLRIQHPRALTKDGRLPLDMVMLSHADADHVQGLLDLKNELGNTEANRSEVPVDIRSMWLNGFDDSLFSDSDPEVVQRVVAAASARSGHTIISEIAARDAELLAAIASTGQCRELREFASGPAQIAVNAEFDGGLIQRGDPGFNSKNILLATGLRATVLGPDKTRVDKLRKRWREDVKKILANESSEISAFDDQSPHNLASIVVVIERLKRRALLTGDGRGDHIVEGLIAQGYMKNKADRVHMDLFKLPHHGSNRNVTTETFRAITADHYLVSANGENGNPDTATLEMLVDGRRKAKMAGRYFVHFTFPDRAFEMIPNTTAAPGRQRQRETLRELNTWLASKRPREFEPVFRERDSLGVVVDLLG